MCATLPCSMPISGAPGEASVQSQASRPLFGVLAVLALGVIALGYLIVKLIAAVV
jgi:hypothetical protein